MYILLFVCIIFSWIVFVLSFHFSLCPLFSSLLSLSSLPLSLPLSPSLSLSLCKSAIYFLPFFSTSILSIFLTIYSLQPLPCLVVFSSTHARDSVCCVLIPPPTHCVYSPPHTVWNHHHHHPSSTSHHTHSTTCLSSRQALNTPQDSTDTDIVNAVN